MKINFHDHFYPIEDLVKLERGDIVMSLFWMPPK